ANRQIALADLGLEGFRSALSARVRAAAFRAALGKAKAGAADEIAKRFDDLATVLQQRPAAGVAQQADVRIIEASAISLNRSPLQAQRAIQSASHHPDQLRPHGFNTPRAPQHDALADTARLSEHCPRPRYDR